MQYCFNPFTHKLDAFEQDTSPGGDLETLTGDAGGAVGPNAVHNIFIVGGAGINIVGNPATNTLTVTNTGAGSAWQFVSVNTVMVVDNGYMAIAPGGNLVFTLPAVAALGTELEIALNGATSWQILQNAANQRIRFGDRATTLGAGGSIQSTAQGDSIRLLCVEANLRWHVLSSIGNLTIV